MLTRHARCVLTSLCLLALTPIVVRATAQAPDVIALDGTDRYLLANPLEAYFSQYPQRRPEAVVVSTGNWRGYVAHFAIVAGALVVTDVRVATDVKGGSRSAMAEVFPGEGLVTARWFTGNLLIPDGKLLNYVHMGYGSIYERYILIRVEAGAASPPILLDRKAFARFRRTQFEAFKRTDEYRQLLREATAHEPAAGAADSERFIFEFASADYVARVFK